jgi:hypothetical protein
MTTRTATTAYCKTTTATTSDNKEVSENASNKGNSLVVEVAVTV